MRETKEIEIKHKIIVDACIADEIEQLNNVHGIVTEYSCCGHGSRGFIIVKNGSVDKMRDLEYESVGRKYELRYVDFPSGKKRDGMSIREEFKPKSICRCKK